MLPTDTFFEIKDNDLVIRAKDYVYRYAVSYVTEYAARGDVPYVSVSKQMGNDSFFWLTIGPESDPKARFMGHIDVMKEAAARALYALMWSKMYRNDGGAVEYSANAFKASCAEIGVSIPYADSFEYDIKRMAVDNNFMSTHLGDNYHMHVGTYITEKYFDGEFATFNGADTGSPVPSDETEERLIAIDSVPPDPMSIQIKS
jgi:hypothetical protein